MNSGTLEDVSLLTVTLLHWRFILACTVAVAALAALLTLLVPKKYGAEAQFLVKDNLQDLTITPAQGVQTPIVTLLNEAEVNSEMQMLLSRDILRAVVMDDHLYDRFLKPGQQTPDASEIALAVMRLEKDLNVAGVRKTNIIQAGYRAHSPELAASVLRDLSRHYLSAHLQAHSTPGSSGFFTNELDRYRGNVERAEAAVGDFRRSSNIFDPEAQRTAMVGQLEDVETRLGNTESELDEGTARLQALEGEDKRTPDRIATDDRSSLNALTVDHLQTELADMENRRIAMTLKFKPTDRGLAELDQEIANTRRNLAAAQTHFSAEHTTTVNPLNQALAAKLSEARVNLRTLDATRKALLQLKASYVAQLSTFDRNSIKLADLNQNLALAQESFVDYSKRTAAATLADQMNQQKFSNVVMIETPVPDPIPVFPSMLLDVLLGAFLGMVAGTMLAFTRTPVRELTAVTA